MPYVVLDFSEDAVAAAKEHGDLLIEGDATEDEDLRRAGIDRARGDRRRIGRRRRQPLHLALGADVRPDIQIVARASDEDAEKKLLLAGADRVVHAVHRCRPDDGEPRAEAAGDVVPRRCHDGDRPRPAHGGDRGRPACANAGKTIRDIRVRHATGAIIVALRKRDGTFDTTPEPDAVIEAGDVIVGVGTTEELQRLEDLFAAALPADPVSALAARLGAGRRARAAERRRARRLRDERGAAARRRAPAGCHASSRRSSSRRPRRSRRSSAPRSPARASSTSSSPTRGLRTRSREILAAGELRRRLGRAAQRIQVEMVSANPTGPITSRTARNGAYGDSVARLLEFARARRRARVLLQRLRRPDGPLPRVGRGGTARGGAARGRLSRRLHRGARARGGRSRRRDAAAHRGVARAVPHPLRLVGAAERRRAATSPELLPRLDTYEADGALWARTTAYGDDKDRVAHPLRRTARSSTSPPTSRTCTTSSSAASTRRSTSSAPTTTATSRG